MVSVVSAVEVRASIVRLAAGLGAGEVSFPYMCKTVSPVKAKIQLQNTKVSYYSEMQCTGGAKSLSESNLWEKM
jgi:hypothetical protein